MLGNMSEKEFLWKQYDQMVELYKFYFGVSIQLYLLFYGITGGILTFYFANINIDTIRYSLLLPVAMSIVFGTLLFYGSTLLRVLSEQVETIAETLNLSVFPDTSVLILFFRISSIIFACVAIAILYLFLTH